MCIRDRDSSLLVRLHFGGSGKEIALNGLALCQRNGGHLFHQPVPLLLRKYKKAAVKTLADVELVSQVVTEL